MVEKNHPFTPTDDKLIEKLIEDDHVAVNHLVLPQGEALPEHSTNSNVYMIVVRGTVSLALDGQDFRHYPKGSLLSIPFRTRMIVANQHPDVLEFFVVKAPSPRSMQGM
jgi:quercetin dioxygenase-like cupin family protein